MNHLAAVALSTAIFFAAVSCKKEVSTANGPNILSTDTLTILDAVALTPFPSAVHSDCTTPPSYGDSILYQQPTNGADYIVMPTVVYGSGVYLAWPEGLVIDPASGAINMSQSQTGQRYNIGFVKIGTTDTCLSSLILSGYSYIDSIYNTDQGTSIASPYFNANVSFASECAAGDGCRFDISGKAAAKGLTIDPETGVINIKNSKKIFGKQPFNGQVVSTTIIYSLNDKSHNVLQSLTVNLVYYDQIASVPYSLSSLITQKRIDILTDQILLTTHGSPKPPLIIITRN